MKKLLGIVLVLGLGLLLVNGCSTSSSSPSSDIPADTVAADIGTLAKNSLAIDNGILLGITTLSIAEPKAADPSTPIYGTDGWWSSTDSYSYGSISYDISYKYKVWDLNSQEIITDSGLLAISSSTDISALWTYTTITYTYTGGTYTISYGASISSPLKFSGYNTGSQTISGPLTFSGSYSGDTYSITYTYGNLTVTGGYPSGTIDWSVSANSSTAYAGQILFDGTNIAIMTFSTGATGSYSVNLDNGTVTPASLN